VILLSSRSKFINFAQNINSYGNAVRLLLDAFSSVSSEHFPRLLGKAISLLLAQFKFDQCNRIITAGANM